MFRKIYLCIIALLACFLLPAQQQLKLPPGFPDRSPNMDVLPGFIHPPKGYGEVSFYWWLGDTLTHDRILWQLELPVCRSIIAIPTRAGQPMD